MPFDLSIVIVSYNTLDMTRACLRSVYDNLGAVKAKIIVVDNNSTDGSPEMIEADFAEVRLIRNTDNRGFAAANNQGFAIATGEHILLLNSDTVVLGEVLPRSVEYLKAHADVGAMGCRVLNTDGTLQRTCSREPSVLNLAIMTLGLDKLRWPQWFGRYQYRHWDRRDERDVEVISGCYLLLRREVLDRVGPLDEAFFFFGEETDWCRRIREAGWRTTLAPVGEIIHHGGGSARKLNDKRDRMLTEALIRFHRKNNGKIHAAAAFLVLGAFNVSRWLGYTALGVVRRSARDRAKHFLGVVRGLPGCWPHHPVAATGARR